MNERYLLGLDAGNTVIKAVLFRTDGTQLAMAGRDGASATPAPGHVERSIPELWDNAQQVIRDCIASAGIDPADIAAIACAGHGNGLYLLDQAGDGLIGIQSLDARAADLAGTLKAQSGAQLHARCLQMPWPAQTATLLAWLKQNAPDTYARAGTVLCAKDVVTWHLTGQRVSEISDMSGGGLLNMTTLAYDTELMQLYGLDDAMGLLPRLLNPSDIAGHVTEAAAAATGLRAGTPVMAGLFDVVASALGSGAAENGQASIIAGSWSINQVLSATPPANPDLFMVTAFRPERFVTLEASATSAANLEWYVRHLVERGGHHDDPFGHCNTAVAATPPAADDPFFHPFLYGSGQGADFRAGFYGLAGWHGEGHLLRALFEGVAFEHKRHIGVMAGAGMQFDTAILSGGGARSPVWPQIFADVLQIPVTVARAEETGALGAAMSAAVGLKLFPGYAAAANAMAAPDRSYTPDPAMTDHYARRYASYTALTDALRPFWASLAAGDR
ncbi:xylulose kinase [Actibacterium mucosum KCTC 23349]|uniref:Xylulose kinase n=1 Tax=Actibacterium mucosum KCTC 23349 TaxID=1454373 RepID=A0A037ZF31_9RHOB|nr:FGGY-family carbohydrate kinase [Actibacterium mucosum]KAJ54742.1 xylulose kinase [Actibacterium mucosum KCTC 23349]